MPKSLENPLPPRERHHGMLCSVPVQWCCTPAPNAGLHQLLHREDIKISQIQHELKCSAGWKSQNSLGSKFSVLDAANLYWDLQHSILLIAWMSWAFFFFSSHELFSLYSLSWSPNFGSWLDQLVGQIPTDEINPNQCTPRDTRVFL